MNPAFLAASHYIDFDHPAVAELARRLGEDAKREGAKGEVDVVRRCFEFVRDEIQHSWDYRRNPVTARASQVLAEGTGYCYAKSHLLAALLRANGIAAGLCYQRLVFDESKPDGFCLHGLNAVYLQDFGWYRIDARGNKPGVQAEFCPPREALAFPIVHPGEADLPEIWSEPLPVVVDALERYTDVAEVAAHLPDVLLLPGRP